MFFTPDLEKTESFYIERSVFSYQMPIAIVEPFYVVGGQGYHHDLFLLSVPNKPAGLNHVAFVVRDIHEVIGGGLNMNRSEWSTFIGPGRHPISRLIFGTSTRLWVVHLNITPMMII